MFGGVFFPSKDHNLQDETKPHEAFESVAPELGARLGYYPIPYLGAEAEGAVMPTKTESGDTAGLWAARGQLVVQYPLRAVSPFVLAGAGALGAGSRVMGSDTDPALHFGVGAKLRLDDFFGLRLDVRDNMSQKNDASNGTQTHHPEALLALTATLGFTKPPEPPKDSDGDGIVDSADACAAQPGPAPTGCPPPPDRDGDGVIDAQDRCPNLAGVAPDGCPKPTDRDNDGVPDDKDKCPDQAAPTPDGCPDLDPDHDGVTGELDRCPAEPETKNGFEDEDGCPDVVPEKVKRFAGVIAGIEFDFGQATLRPASSKVLDQAVAILNEYPSLRLLVSGHTDATGDRERNLDLSRRRAETVKAYLVGKGIAETRLETRGAGPDEPIADNETPQGQQKNRRIEFKLLESEPSSPAPAPANP